MINANTQLLTEGGGQARNINGVLGMVGDRLDHGLEKATSMINAVEPGLFSGPSQQVNQAAVPWMAIAQAELAKPVVEGDPIIGNPEIARYFSEATNFHPGPGHTAWCGAFAAFCITRTGLTAGRLADSQVASHWLEFGTKLRGPEFGAIAVLDPLVARSTGHVGFVKSWNAGTLQLLAGNQHNPDGAHAVCIKQFDIRKVRGWRTVERVRA